MKRCPECRRDYYGHTLLYCVDDGNALLEGPASGSGLAEPATAIFHATDAPSEAATRAQINTTRDGDPARRCREAASTKRRGIVFAGVGLALIVIVAGG
ncbi:MAG: hypothetical protein AB7J13_02510 [Pyrinomonadaceae bacterium]